MLLLRSALDCQPAHCKRSVDLAVSGELVADSTTLSGRVFDKRCRIQGRYRKRECSDGSGAMRQDRVSFNTSARCRVQCRGTMGNDEQYCKLPLPKHSSQARLPSTTVGKQRFLCRAILLRLGPAGFGHTLSTPSQSSGNVDHGRAIGRLLSLFPLPCQPATTDFPSPKAAVGPVPALIQQQPLQNNHQQPQLQASSIPVHLVASLFFLHSITAIPYRPASSASSRRLPCQVALRLRSSSQHVTQPLPSFGSFAHSLFPSFQYAV